MNNRGIVEKTLKEKGFRIGCWSLLMELLPKIQLEKVTENIFNKKEVDVSIRRKKYIVKIDRTNDVVDFLVFYKEQ